MQTVRLFNNGMAKYQKKEYDKAIDLFRKGMQDPRITSQCLANIGICMEAQNRFHDAVQIYLRGIPLDKPKFSRMICNNLARFVDDLPFLVTVIRNARGSSLVLYTAATVLFVMMDRNPARKQEIFNVQKECCYLALANDPKNPDNLRNMAKVYYIGDDIANAVKLLEQIPNPDTETTYQLLLARLKEKHRDLIPLIHGFANLAPKNWEWSTRVLDLYACYYNTNKPNLPENRDFNFRYNRAVWEHHDLPFLALSEERRIATSFAKDSHITQITQHHSTVQFGSFLEKVTTLIQMENVYISEYNIFGPDTLYCGEKGYNKYCHLSLGSQVVRIPKGNVVFHIAHTNVCNYFHWVVECLGRLLDFFSKCPEQTMENTTIIVPYTEPMSKFIFQTLSFLGFEKNVMFTKPDTSYFCPKVYSLDYAAVDSHRPDTFHVYSPSREAIRLVREKLSVVSQSETGLIIYLRRAKGVRHIGDDSNLVSGFREKYGDRFVVFESGSFKEQQELFAQAQLIMGPHGAGLTNMVLAPPGTHIIEFPLKPNCNICYEYMAACLDCHHQYYDPIHSYYYGNFQNPTDSMVRDLLGMVSEIVS